MNWESLLSSAAQADLTGNLIIVFIIWKFMAKKISDHFSGLESSLKKVAQELTEVKIAITADLKAQSKRMNRIEDRVSKLEGHN